MNKLFMMTCVSMLVCGGVSAAPCSFDSSKTCVIERDILNDKQNNLNFYAPTNYDHRISGEIQTYKSNLVIPYVSSPNQLALKMQNQNGQYTAGEIMTKANLDQPPFSAPVKSNVWTTKNLKHGYLEVISKLPVCETSIDGVCQKGNPPTTYSQGFWPAIWLEPTMDGNWPQNGEIDIMEAYKMGLPMTTSTATIHFCNGPGATGGCGGDYAGGSGFGLTDMTASRALYLDFHKWGFEWQPDIASKTGGQILSGYLDDKKIWTLQTDSLPADGKNALSRGFNDPNGGYYLIVNFAMGGPYAGSPNPQALTSTMYVQSVKSYAVSGGVEPSKNCVIPPYIGNDVTPDKKQITISWQQPDATTLPVVKYQVYDWNKKLLWSGSAPNIRVFQDQTLPGTPNNYIYFLQTVCANASSELTQYTVTIM